jgi:alanine racemase
LGLLPETYQKVFLELLMLKKQGHIHQITHMTHFANADISNQTPAHLQDCDTNSAWGLFSRQIIDLYHQSANQSLEFLKDVFHISAANSGAILWHPQTHLSPIEKMTTDSQNWVRGGIMLYGASPSGIFTDIANSNLQPTMSLKAKIISIQTLNTGDAVGYGSQFIAPEPMKIATIACGYADGYPRIAKNAPVYLKAKKTQTLGRVSMDMIAIDLRGYQNHANVEVGDEVLLWGQSHQSPTDLEPPRSVYLPIDEVANTAQTIGYELMCGITKRVQVLPA